MQHDISTHLYMAGLIIERAGDCSKGVSLRTSVFGAQM